jgi:DNA-directed RNA polymerase subunit RPC12/RpoP
MTRYYGVKCEICGTRIALGRCENKDGTITFYTVPLEPIPCEACGKKHLYKSGDLFEFEAEDDISLNPL